MNCQLGCWLLQLYYFIFFFILSNQKIPWVYTHFQMGHIFSCISNCLTTNNDLPTNFIQCYTNSAVEMASLNNPIITQGQITEQSLNCGSNIKHQLWCEDNHNHWVGKYSKDVCITYLKPNIHAETLIKSINEQKTQQRQQLLVQDLNCIPPE